MTAAELAKMSGVATHVVRYYTRLGLLRPGCNLNGYKAYDHADAERVRFIRRAQNLSFTLKKIGQIFDAGGGDGKSPCRAAVSEIIRHRMKENTEELDKLTRQQMGMEKALAGWSKMPNQIPDGKSVCHLIESLAEEEADEET